MSETPPFEHLLNDVPPPDAAVLRKIVGRRDRRVRGMGAVLLVAGLLLGLVIRPQTDHKTAAEPAQLLVAPTTPSTTFAGGSDNAPSPHTAITLNKVFSRLRDGSMINLFHSDSSACVQVDVSRPEWAYTSNVSDISPTTRPVLVLLAQVVGAEKGDPYGLVVAKVAPQISAVTFTFPDGSKDTVTPSGGFIATAVAVDAETSNLGVIQAQDISGQVRVRSQIPVTAPAQCLVGQ